MRILLVGFGPHPQEPGALVTGPAIRLRQFLEPLQAAKHDVVVALLEDARRSRPPVPGAAAAEAFPPELIDQPEAVAQALDLNFVEAVFGVGSLLPAYAACRIAEHLKKPCWVDFFGDPLAELHAAQLRQGGLLDTTARDHVWKLMRQALLRGDAFSGVSTPQRYAILGQLGLLGRFGTDWEASRRVAEIPCAVPDDWVRDGQRRPFSPALRELGMTQESRYIFFGGSWNVWLDEGTMAKALAGALREDPQLRFVCCGIPTGPAGEQIRLALLKDLAPFREQGRIHELQPQHLEEESALLSWAGACLSLDRPIPEAELGSRNRLLAMVRWGARPVVSLEAGVEAELVAEGLAAGIVDGNHERAAKEIIAACHRSPEEREDDRQRGLQWLRTVTFGETLRPAVTWLSRGAPRWPATPATGMLDQWASFPADPERLFAQAPAKKKSWFSRG